ncbi:DUF3325 domain-containing protein [Teichococcus oryzae]|nr:DUF3325 domain-containing protein [Pseudoroseomonas oryzae]
MAFSLVFAGFMVLGLSMDRHHERILRRRGPAWWQRKLLLASGFLLLAAALALLLATDDGGQAVVGWFGLMSLAAMVMVLLVSYHPRSVPVLAASLLASGILLALC